MAYSNTTPHYGLPQFVASDEPSWLTDVNEAMLAIDTQMNKNASSGGDAESSAGAALEAAQAAQAAANNAQSAAQSAVEQAAEAKSQASTAQTTAIQAQTQAQTAATAADNALSKADEAETQANTAISAASAAQTMANQASEDATDAMSDAAEALKTSVSGVRVLCSKMAPLSYFITFSKISNSQSIGAILLIHNTDSNALNFSLYNNCAYPILVELPNPSSPSVTLFNTVSGATSTASFSGFSPTTIQPGGQITIRGTWEVTQNSYNLWISSTFFRLTLQAPNGANTEF